MAPSNLKRVTALESHKGNLWVAAYEEGLFVWEGSKWRKQNGVPPYLTSLSSDGNYLWYGTWMQGKIGYLKASRVTQIPLPRLVVPRFAYRVTCIVASESAVWLGTQGYLIRYDVEAGDWSHLVSVGTVDALLGLPQGLWLCAGGQVLHVQHSPNHFSVATVPAFTGVSVSVLAIAGDALWVGASRQAQPLLGKYQVKDGRLQWSEVPSRGFVRAILQVGNNVFVGLEEGGVWRYYQREDRWERVATNLVESVSCLVKVGHSLVIGGEEGVEFIEGLQ